MECGYNTGMTNETNRTNQPRIDDLNARIDRVAERRANRRNYRDVLLDSRFVRAQAVEAFRLAASLFHYAGDDSDRDTFTLIAIRAADKADRMEAAALKVRDRLHAERRRRLAA
jgi:hypothetical protein